MLRFLNAFHKNESGATMVEYGLMVAVIAMVVIIGAISLGITMGDTMDDTARCSNAPSVANCILD